MKKLTIIGSIALISTTVLAKPAAQIATPNKPSTEFTQNQTQHIEKIVRNYLLKNPSILIDMSKELKKQKRAAKINSYKMTVAKIKQNKVNFFKDITSPIVGNKKGDIKLMEFYDYNCGHCKIASQNVEQLITNNEDLKVILKDLPIFGGNSLLAAKISLAAYKINPKRYYQFHKLLMGVNGVVDMSAIVKMAEKSGYEPKQLIEASNSEYVGQQLKQTANLAKLINLNGTPAFIIANKDLSKLQYIPGALPIEQMQNVINSIR